MSGEFDERTLFKVGGRIVGKNVKGISERSYNFQFVSLFHQIGAEKLRIPFFEKIWLHHLYIFRKINRLSNYTEKEKIYFDKDSIAAP